MTAPPTLGADLSEKRKQFLLDLFTTALEGGIGYWSKCSEYRWRKPEAPETHFPDRSDEDLDNFHAVIHPTEDGWGVWADKLCGDTEEDTKPLRIDLEVMARGAKLMSAYVQGFYGRVAGSNWVFGEFTPARDGHYYWQFVQAYTSNGDAGDYDADVADMVVQFGLFGEAVYG